MTRTHRLYLQDQITSQGFGDFYKPTEARLNQLLAELPKLQAEVDLLKVNKLSADDVCHEATSLYERWPSLPAQSFQNADSTPSVSLNCASCCGVSQ